MCYMLPQSLVTEDQCYEMSENAYSIKVYLLTQISRILLPTFALQKLLFLVLGIIRETKWAKTYLGNVFQSKLYLGIDDFITAVDSFPNLVFYTTISSRKRQFILTSHKIYTPHEK